jgi:hypothetical protein
VAKTTAVLVATMTPPGATTTVNIILTAVVIVAVALMLATVKSPAVTDARARFTSAAPRAYSRPGRRPRVRPR